MTKLLTRGINEVAFLSNTIVRSPLNLSNLEARLFILALGCLHQKEDSLEFEMHFQDVIPSVGGKSYTLLDEAITRLTLPLVTRTKKTGKQSSTRTALFSTIKLDEGTRMIVGRFNSDLKQYLLDLSGNFTTVELVSLLTLKSANSHRLFWILKSYHHQPNPDPIDFQTLRTWLFGENSEIYPKWADFNRYLLLPTLAEFKAIGWDVTVEIQKRGRRIDALLFKMSRTLELVSKNQPVIKKTLTYAEALEFQKTLAATYIELPPIYYNLQVDFELKEYQAREVVMAITDQATYQLVTKVLYNVKLALSDGNNIKSVAAYTLSQLKAVLNVYQPLGGFTGVENHLAEAPKPKHTRRKQESKEHLTFAKLDVPTPSLLNEVKPSQLTFQLLTPGAKVTPTQKRAIQKLESQLDDVKTSLRFVRDEAPENLYTPAQRAAKVQELIELIDRLRAQLGK